MGGGIWAFPGYRIPLPRGRYQVSLHFCVTHPRPYPARNGIEIEGVEVREAFDPIERHGFGVPYEERIELEVTDGALDIVLTEIQYIAGINAVEVRAVAGTVK